MPTRARLRHPRAAALALPLLLLAACSSTPAVTDLERARRSVEAFRQVSPVAAEHLPRAAAWAVFPDTLDTRAACQHRGYVFTAEGEPRPAVLTCSQRPENPAGTAYHELILLLDPADLALLERAPLDLTGAPHVDVSATAADPLATRLVITTTRSTLLFDPAPPHQLLQLAAP